MSVLATGVDPRSSGYLERRSVMLEQLGELMAAVAAAAGPDVSIRCGRPPRGGLSARARVELLVDRDTPLLELSPTAGLGTGHPVGAELVTAIGLVGRSLCLIVADDPALGRLEHRAPPTHAVNPLTIRKAARAAEIARANLLPLVHLSDGRLRDRAMNVASLFPDGSTSCDLADLSADQEREALHSLRHTLTRFAGGARARAFPAGTPQVDDPVHDQSDLLALGPGTDPALGPFEPREILARILDGSHFEELDVLGTPGGQRPTTGLCTGWGAIHGHPVGLIADGATPPQTEDLTRGIRFIHLASRAAVPTVLLLHWSGANHPGSALLEAAVTAAVPHVIVSLGPAPCPSEAFRFHFRWPMATVSEHPDDGMIDPRDTRSVLGLTLAVLSRGGSGARFRESP